MPAAFTSFLPRGIITKYAKKMSACRWNGPTFSIQKAAFCFERLISWFSIEFLLSLVALYSFQTKKVLILLPERHVTIVSNLL